MSSFSQWFVSYQKKPAIKQVTWICGTEPVLMDDILDTLLTHFSEEPWCRSVYVVGDQKERLIWEDADQHPIDGRTPRVIVVKGAEKLKKPERIIEWVNHQRRNPMTYLVFLADTPELEREEPTEEQKKERKKGPLVPHLAALQGKATMVECKPFTQATAKHAVSWVQSKVEIRRGVAGKLLERANGDLRLTRDAFRKLSQFPDEISEQTINLLLSARPRLSFVDALLEVDKSAALLALDYLPKSEYSQVIGLLDQRIELLGTVRDLLMSHSSQAQISAALGTQGFLAQDLIPLAKVYDRKRRQEIRKLLAATDEALRLGVTDGPVQALVLFW